MPKGYMISAHRSPADPEKSNAYRELAKPALEKHGGKYLAGGGRVVAKENGIAERTILIEFKSFEAAVLLQSRFGKFAVGVALFRVGR